MEKWQNAQEKMRQLLEKVTYEESPFEGRYVQELQNIWKRWMLNFLFQIVWKSEILIIGGKKRMPKLEF